MAEGKGFEPLVPRGTTVFKTVAFDRSATPPRLFVCLLVVAAPADRGRAAGQSSDRGPGSKQILAGWVVWGWKVREAAGEAWEVVAG